MKSNSYKFVQSIIMSDRWDKRKDYDKIEELEVSNLVGATYECLSSGSQIVTDMNGHRILVVSYDKNADFDYVTNTSCVCDGTLVFHLDSISKCFNKVLSGETIFTPNLPDDFETNRNSYFVKYTVGNPVVCSKMLDESQDNDKPWLTDEVTVVLPIKFECERKK